MTKSPVEFRNRQRQETVVNTGDSVFCGVIPRILILPDYFGIFGVWVSFPIADVLAASLTGLFLRKEMQTKLKADGVL